MYDFIFLQMDDYVASVNLGEYFYLVNYLHILRCVPEEFWMEIL